MADQIAVILFARVPAKVCKGVVGRVAVTMAGVVPGCWARSDKGLQDKHMDPLCSLFDPSAIERYQAVAPASQSWRKDFALKAFDASGSINRTVQASDSALIGNLVQPFIVRHGLP